MKNYPVNRVAIVSNAAGRTLGHKIAHTLREVLIENCSFTKHAFLHYPGMEKHVQAGLYVNMTSCGADKYRLIVNGESHGLFLCNAKMKL